MVEGVWALDFFDGFGGCLSLRFLLCVCVCKERGDGF